ncbi:MAG TPA: oxidoreductase, partial [Planctomycetaceae bacterium]|nr:oxidoreductase [Planctomycetaceae bacterium]HCP84287.1 oxidoreductase [Planctomycetaceae bacterium]
MQVNRQITRRRLIQTSAVVASGVFVNPSAAQESNSPNERLNIASIGCTGRAAGNLDGVASQNIVAIADIDTNLLEKGSARFEGAAKYSDFRELLDKEHEKIDAVVVSTPDHCHA